MISILLFVVVFAAIAFFCYRVFFTKGTSMTMKAMGAGTLVISTGLLGATVLELRPKETSAATARKGSTTLPSRVLDLPVIGAVLKADAEERHRMTEHVEGVALKEVEDAVLQASSRLIARHLGDAVGAAPDKVLTAGFGKVAAVFTAAKEKNLDFCVHPAMRLLKTNPAGKEFALNLLTAFQEIYEAGRGGQQVKQSVTLDTFKATMATVKITRADFDTLYSSDSDEAQCEVITKMMTAIGRIPSKERGPVVRYYLRNMVIAKL